MHINTSRKKVQMEGSTMDLLVLMSEGNPGGMTVLNETHENRRTPRSFVDHEFR